MLATLNTFLTEADSAAAADRVLWEDDGEGASVTVACFRSQLAALRQKLLGCEQQRWLLYSDDPHNFLLGLLALLGLKKQVIVCASRQPAWLHEIRSEFDAILSDEQIVLASEPTATAQAECGKPLVNFSQLAGSGATWQPHYDGSEALVFFTSGSTGVPKAINKTLQALTNEASTLGATFAGKLHASLFMASVSHLHIYGLLFRLLLPLLVGASSIRQLVEYPEQLLRLAARPGRAARMDNAVFISSPTFLSRLDLHLPPLCMQAVFSSGGPLPLAAARDAQQYFAQVPIEVYGSTETGGIAWRQQHGVAVPWTPFSGVQLSAGADGTALLSPNMPGEPPYLLDDHLEFLPDGRFELQGRKDRIVKIAEKRISLTAIEQFLLRQNTILQCVALPLAGKRDIIVCAVVLSAEGLAMAADAGRQPLISLWKAAMKPRFEAVSIPRQWRLFDGIPVNSQSKIDTARLLAAFAGRQETR